jgi:condensation domain-containing protein
MWRAVQLNAPNLLHLNLRLTVPVPTGLGLEDTFSALSMLMARHHALRTRFHVDESCCPRQTVFGSGEIAVELHDSREEDPSRTAERAVAALRALPFTVPEFAVRAAVITTGGVPSAVVLVVFHLAIDGWAVYRLKDDLERIMRKHAGESVNEPEPRVVQPSDRAEYEFSRRGAERSEKSLQYWKDQILAFPAANDIPSRRAPETPRFQEIHMHSRALQAAVRTLSEHAGVSSQSVYVSLASTILAERSGQRRVGFLIFCHNRFTRSAKDLSGCLVQNYPVTVETGRRPLLETLRAIHTSLSNGIFSAQYDPAALASMLELVRQETGHVPDLSCAVNLLSTMLMPSHLTTGGAARDEDDLSALAGLTRFTKGSSMEHEDMSIYLTVRQSNGETTVSLRADTALFSPSEICDCLRHMERLSLAWIDSLT